MGVPLKQKEITPLLCATKRLHQNFLRNRAEQSAAMSSPQKCCVGQSDDKSGVVKEPSESQEEKVWERNSCTRCPNGQIYFNSAETQREEKDPPIQRKSLKNKEKPAKIVTFFASLSGRY